MLCRIFKYYHSLLLVLLLTDINVSAASAYSGNTALMYSNPTTVTESAPAPAQAQASAQTPNPLSYLYQSPFAAAPKITVPEDSYCPEPVAAAVAAAGADSAGRMLPDWQPSGGQLHDGQRPELLSGPEPAVTYAGSQIIDMGMLIQAYNESFGKVQLSIIQASENALFYLTSAMIIISGIYLLFHEGGTVLLFCLHLIRIIMTVGIVEFLILHGPEIAQDIINTFIALGNSNGSSLNPVNPMELFNRFFLVVEHFFHNVTWGNVIFLTIFSVFIYCAIALLIVIFLATFINAYIVAVSGIIVVILGVFRYTRPLSFNYFWQILAFALRLFALNTINRVGLEVIEAQLGIMDSLHASGHTITLQDAGIVALIMAVIVALALTVPRSLARLIHYQGIGISTSYVYRNLSQVSYH